MRLPRMTTRRWMVLVAVVALGFVGAKSPNSYIALLAVELLLLGAPAMLLWRPSPPKWMIVAMSVWATIALPVGLLIVLEVQAYLHGYTL